MDPVTALGAAGSIIGIASFGLQLGQTLYQFVDEARSAKENLQILTEEINSTSNALKHIYKLLEEEKELRADHLHRPHHNRSSFLFSSKALDDVKDTADKCLIIFWRIEGTVANIRHVENQLIQRLIKFNEEVQTNKEAVTISLDNNWSIRRRIRWPSIVPKLKSYSRQLDTLKLNLVLIIQVISLGYQRNNPKLNSEDLFAVVRIMESIRRIAAQIDLSEFLSPSARPRLQDSPRPTQRRLESPAGLDFFSRIGSSRHNSWNNNRHRSENSPVRQRILSEKRQQNKPNDTWGERSDAEPASRVSFEDQVHSGLPGKVSHNIDDPEYLSKLQAAREVIKTDIEAKQQGRPTRNIKLELQGIDVTDMNEESPEKVSQGGSQKEKETVIGDDKMANQINAFIIADSIMPSSSAPYIQEINPDLKRTKICNNPLVDVEGELTDKDQTLPKGTSSLLSQNPGQGLNMRKLIDRKIQPKLPIFPKFGDQQKQKDVSFQENSEADPKAAQPEEINAQMPTKEQLLNTERRFVIPPTIGLQTPTPPSSARGFVEESAAQSRYSDKKVEGTALHADEEEDRTTSFVDNSGKSDTISIVDNISLGNLDEISALQGLCDLTYLAGSWSLENHAAYLERIKRHRLKFWKKTDNLLFVLLKEYTRYDDDGRESDAIGLSSGNIKKNEVSSHIRNSVPPKEEPASRINPQISTSNQGAPTPIPKADAKINTQPASIPKFPAQVSQELQNHRPIPPPPVPPPWFIPQPSIIPAPIMGHQALDEKTCTRLLSTYCMWVIQKSVIKDQSKNKFSWDRCKTTRELIPSNEVLRKIEELDDENDLTVIDKKLDLPLHQQRQIARLIQRVIEQEADPHYEWTLRQIEPTYKIKGIWQKDELEAISVYLCRAPNRYGDAVTLYCRTHPPQPNSLPPPPPLPPVPIRVSPQPPVSNTKKRSKKKDETEDSDSSSTISSWNSVDDSTTESGSRSNPRRERPQKSRHQSRGKGTYSSSGPRVYGRRRDPFNYYTERGPVSTYIVPPYSGPSGPSNSMYRPRTPPYRRPHVVPYSGSHQPPIPNQESRTPQAISPYYSPYELRPPRPSNLTTFENPTEHTDRSRIFNLSSSERKYPEYRDTARYDPRNDVEDENIDRDVKQLLLTWTPQNGESDLIEERRRAMPAPLIMNEREKPERVNSPRSSITKDTMDQIDIEPANENIEPISMPGEMEQNQKSKSPGHATEVIEMTEGPKPPEVSTKPHSGSGNSTAPKVSRKATVDDISDSSETKEKIGSIGSQILEVDESAANNVNKAKGVGSPAPRSDSWLDHERAKRLVESTKDSHEASMSDLGDDWRGRQRHIVQPQPGTAHLRYRPTFSTSGQYEIRRGLDRRYSSPRPRHYEEDIYDSDSGW
ncbi:hypothetical protein B7463_g6035, partial [Scytalidium lignicola]